MGVRKYTSSPQVEATASKGAASYSAAAVGVSSSSARIDTLPTVILSWRMGSLLPYICAPVPVC